MKCPMCEKDRFIEIDTSQPSWIMDYGWSIKECLQCGYKVKDRTFDGRFAGIDHVIWRSSEVRDERECETDTRRIKK